MSRCYVAVRKMSDAIVKHSTSTTMVTTSSETPKVQQILRGKSPVVVLRRMKKDVVPNSPK